MPRDADRFLPFDPSRLREKTVVLHGATGAVGSCVLERLVEARARIAVPVRRAFEVEPMRERLASADALVVHVGSRDAEAAAGFAKGAADSLGPIDALVSTAGAFAVKPVGQERSGADLDLAEANWLSIHNLVRAVIGPMRRRRAGCLVFTGAAAVGSAEGAGLALYLASKAALHEYARCLAAEIGGEGVAVAVIAPGIVDTETNRGAMPDSDRSGWTAATRVADALLGAAAGAPAGDDDPVHVLTADGRRRSG